VSEGNKKIKDRKGALRIYLGGKITEDKRWSMPAMGNYLLANVVAKILRMRKLGEKSPTFQREKKGFTCKNVNWGKRQKANLKT